MESVIPLTGMESAKSTPIKKILIFYDILFPTVPSEPNEILYRISKNLSEPSPSIIFVGYLNKLADMTAKLKWQKNFNPDHVRLVINNINTISQKFTEIKKLLVQKQLPEDFNKTVAQSHRVVLEAGLRDKTKLQEELHKKVVQSCRDEINNKLLKSVVDGLVTGKPKKDILANPEFCEINLSRLEGYPDKPVSHSKKKQTAGYLKYIANKKMFLACKKLHNGL